METRGDMRSCVDVYDIFSFSFDDDTIYEKSFWNNLSYTIP